METKSMTIGELATYLDCEYSIAAGLVKFLTIKKLIKNDGFKPNPTGKGKAAITYAIPVGEIKLTIVS